MTTTTSPATSPEPPAPDEVLAALHEQGPAALAELLGDVGYLLVAVATAPKKMFEVEKRPRQDYKNLLDMIHGAVSALNGLEARAVVALAEATVRDRVERARNEVAHEDDFLPPLEQLIRQADAATAADLSLATRRSPSVARSSLASARRLVGSMPRTLSALSTGKITAQVAYATSSSASVLDPLQRRQVDELLHEKLPEMNGAGVKKWRAAVQKAAAQVDAEGAARRHLKAREDRHVSLTPGEHGMATLSAHLTAVDAKAIHKRLSLEAERRRAEGEREGHGALMADALVSTLLGREDEMEPVMLDVGVIVTDRALIDPGEGDLAELEGYGPVPVEAVRQELRDALTEPAIGEKDRYGPDGPQVRAVLRRLYTHPTSGELVAVESRAREFPPALKRFLLWRDTRCRTPYCDAPVRQFDHIDPHSRGGTTSLDNGQGLCAGCNQRKEDAFARVERVGGPVEDGHLVEWTGHGGTAVVVGPARLEDSGAASGITVVRDEAVPTEALADVASDMDALAATAPTAEDDRIAADAFGDARTDDAEHVDDGSAEPSSPDAATGGSPDVAACTSAGHDTGITVRIPADAAPADSRDRERPGPPPMQAMAEASSMIRRSLRSGSGACGARRFRPLRAAATRWWLPAAGPRPRCQRPADRSRSAPHLPAVPRDRLRSS